MTNRDIGELGENTLERWAIQAGITANKAFKDKHGWDYLLEYPLEELVLSDKMLPLDKRSYPLKCFVQVKASDGRPGKLNVKLDNWERLVRNPLPAFFLICEFDGRDQCQRAYLVHIDEFYIHQVLRKLREFSAAGISDIHKRHLTVRYSNEHLLSSLNGQGLAIAIKSHIPSDLAAYSSAKMASVRTAGYGDSAYQMHFKGELPKEYDSLIDLLVDFSLGLIPRIDAKEVEVRDIRFGIEVPELRQVKEGGRLEIKELHPVTKAILVFSSTQPFREMQIEADVYIPQGLGIELDTRHRKIRFSVPFINLVVPAESARGQLQFEFPRMNEQHLLSQLQPVSDLILFLDEAMRSNSVIDHKIIIDSRRTIMQPLDLVKEDIKFPQLAVECAQAVHSAWNIAKYFDIHNRVELRISELHAQLPWLNCIADSLGGRTHWIRVSYPLYENDPDATTYSCIPLVSSIVLGQYQVIVGLAVLGVPATLGLSNEVPKGVECELKTDNIRFHAGRVLQRKETSEECAKRIFIEIVNSYKPSAKIRIIEGLNDHLNEPPIPI